MYAFPGLYMPRVGSRQASLNKLIWCTLLCYLLCSGDKIKDYTGGNQDIITLNWGKDYKNKTKQNKTKLLVFFFSRQSRFYLSNCFRIFPLGVAVEKYLLVNSRSLHSDKSISPKTRTLA